MDSHCHRDDKKALPLFPPLSVEDVWETANTGEQTTQTTRG